MLSLSLPVITPTTTTTTAAAAATTAVAAAENSKPISLKAETGLNTNERWKQVSKHTIHLLYHHPTSSPQIHQIIQTILYTIQVCNPTSQK